MWYAAIDWADRHHDAVIIEDAGKRGVTIGVEHGTERFECILEANRGLLIAALLAAGPPVYPVNPKTVDRHRGPSGAKTDVIDAYLLARTGGCDLANLRRLAPDNPAIAVQFLPLIEAIQLTPSGERRS